MLWSSAEAKESTACAAALSMLISPPLVASLPDGEVCVCFRHGCVGTDGIAEAKCPQLGEEGGHRGAELGRAAVPLVGVCL